MKYLFKNLRKINKPVQKSLPRLSPCLSTLRILGTLIVSGAFLAPQILLLPQPVLADKAGVCAVPGKDGPGTISGILNSYYPGATGATVAVGATSIPVGAINSVGSSTPIAAGDLLLIIQMQDAAINSTNTDAYGDGVGGDVVAPVGVTTAPPPLGASGWTNLNKAGRYEYAVATGPVSGGAIPISQGTVNSYSQSAATATQGQSTYQVVRVPQYSSGTITGTVTTSARWNGSSGGIVAFDVAGQLNLGGGTVDVNGLGFRGGGTNKNGVTNGGNAQTNYRSTDTGAGTGSDAPKGEGIAGTPRLVSQQPFGSFNVRSSTVTIDNSTQGYPNGDDSRGAPANAGGGGDEHNAGGGGGANAGNGGLGGRSFTYTGGGAGFNYYVGGFGGTALTADPTRLVLGGGGGAGDVNDQVTPSGSGGGGGGMVFIRTGAVSGSGTINAKGANGIDSPGGSPPDAGGGGGAGGTALVTVASGSLAGLTINATGGIGGNLNENGTSETDGPGAGGGGGAVYTTGGVTADVSGGAAGLIINGTVNNNTSNGATAGTSGINQTVSAASLTSSISGSATCVPQLTVTKTTSTPTTYAGGTATYTITVANAANRTSATQVDISDALPAGFTYASVGSVNLTGGATQTTTTNPSVGATNPSFGQFTIPPGGQVQITFTVNVVAGTAPGTYQNPATATYLDPTRTTTTGTTTATYNSASSTGEDVTVSALDFGDAPASYGTLLANNGARHTITGLYLGAGVSAETDGQPNATATGDTNDDGITFSPTLGANYSTLVQAGVSNQIQVVSSGAGFVNAWIDYNKNGVFDSGELILSNKAVVAGTNTLTFTPDNRQLHGSTFARFRLSPTSIASPSPVGLIVGGEVEDYQVYVAAPVPDGAACATTGLLNGGFENPVQGATTYKIYAKSFIPGWNTNASDQAIEVWSTGYQGVPAYAGNQFAEMNANMVASLYQDIATVPGSTIIYQFAHRARSPSGPVLVDTASFKAGPPGALVNLINLSSDSTDWIVYRGTYVVPAGQYITRVQFDSIASGYGKTAAGAGNNAVGNFLDGVQFSTNNCVTPISPPTIDLDGNNSTATGNNYQNTFTVGGAAVAAADTDVVITDDQTNITRAIFTLTNTPDGANESLTIDPTAGGTVTGVSVDSAYDSTAGTSTTGRLTLKGSATLSDYQKVIATLKYSNTKASPTTSDRTINVQVIDSDKAISNTATSTIKIANPVSISGTVFSDADADVTINGSDAGTNAGSANLTIYAVDTAGKVLNKATVAANGTYSLANVPANSSVTLRLSNDNTVAIGATAPTASSIPSGWYYTGENQNGTVDGTIATLGNIALTTTTSNLTNENFGIRQAYTITADPAPTTCNPDYSTALNTGITAAGGQLAVGANDLNWTAEWIAGPASGPGTPYAPPRPVGPMPAVVIGNLAFYAWVNEPANARWISYPFRLSVNSNGNHKDADLDGIQGEGNPSFSGPGTSDDVRVRFTSTLTLPSNANTSAISLPIGVAIDNQFVSIKVNGVENLVPTPAANPIAHEYESLKTVNITNGWQAGVNTIEVIVDSTPDLVGFLLGVQATSTQVCGKSNVVLVKRITAINGVSTINPSDNTTHLDQVLDNPATPNDDATVKWPSGYLVGAFNAGKIKPGDVLEYTVYFLNAKGANANTVKICDRIIGSQTYKTSSLEIRLGNATSSISLSDAADPALDRGQFYPSSASAPAACNLITPGTGVADNGTWAVDVMGTGSSAQPDFTTMPSATAPGTPTASYGFIRFKTIVNP